MTATEGNAPLRTLCRTVLEALMVVDDDRNFIRVNESATRLFRSGSSDLTTHTIDNYTSYEFAPLLDPLWDCFEREGELRGCYEVRRGDGSTQLVEYSAAREFAQGLHLIAAREVHGEVAASRPAAFALVEPVAGRFVEVSKELGQVLSRSTDELLAEGSLGLFRERVGGHRLLNAVREIVDGRRANLVANAYAAGPDGEPLSLSLALSRVTGKDRRSVLVLLQATADSRAGGPELTPRQTEILSLIATGHTDRQIAGRLNLSVRTVEWHRDRLRKELGAHTRADLFRAARDRGLLD